MRQLTRLIPVIQLFQIELLNLRGRVRPSLFRCANSRSVVQPTSATAHDPV